ncbi:hypothetical protein [Halosaccharopolyspora lacisalsi]|uniref:hypothetical protein n=1 Tax=Halosaccharopolyspora lacisalsi TaxID=1000566 RepID=UPI002E289ED9|nr:hypothetical protein [Halosaccharopolyspora lacisalsi]
MPEEPFRAVEPPELVRLVPPLDAEPPLAAPLLPEVFPEVEEFFADPDFDGDPRPLDVLLARVELRP